MAEPPKISPIGDTTEEDRERDRIRSVYGEMTHDTFYSTLVPVDNTPPATPVYRVPVNHVVVTLCRKNRDKVGFDIDTRSLIGGFYYELPRGFVDAMWTKIVDTVRELGPKPE